jgi:hypothetical protein
LAGETGTEPELLTADSQVPRLWHYPVQLDRVRRADQLLRADNDPPQLGCSRHGWWLADRFGERDEISRQP